VPNLAGVVHWGSAPRYLGHSQPKVPAISRA